MENDWDGEVDCPEVMGPDCLNSKEEVDMAIKGLRIGKAAGPAGVVSEMIKAAGGFGLRWMTDLINNIVAPNDTAYKRWSCHSGLKLLCKLCQPPRPQQWVPDLPFFGHAGHADPLDGWRCCSQKRVMSRPIQVRQL